MIRLQISLGRWFDSGSKEGFYLFKISSHKDNLLHYTDFLLSALCEHYYNIILGEHIDLPHGQRKMSAMARLEVQKDWNGKLIDRKSDEAAEHTIF